MTSPSSLIFSGLDLGLCLSRPLCLCCVVVAATDAGFKSPPTPTGRELLLFSGGGGCCCCCCCCGGCCTYSGPSLLPFLLCSPPSFRRSVSLLVNSRRTSSHSIGRWITKRVSKRVRRPSNESRFTLRYGKPASSSASRATYDARISVTVLRSLSAETCEDRVLEFVIVEPLWSQYALLRRRRQGIV